MRVLLHACCGPCASACVPALRDLGNEVALFYSNSNIAPAEEFEKRGESLRKLAEADGVDMIVEAQDHADWLEKVAKGHENDSEKGERCERCFRYNLARTAAYAAAHGFDAFTTSLTVSPHKVSEVIFRAGRSAADSLENAQCGKAPDFLEVNFKKKNGFLKSLARAAELGLYRQGWCGCEFSKRDAGKKDVS